MKAEGLGTPQWGGGQGKWRWSRRRKKPSGHGRVGFLCFGAMAGWLCVGGLGLPSGAEAEEAVVDPVERAPVPPRPDIPVLDGVGIFSSSQREGILGAIGRIRRDTGLEVFVVTTRVVAGESPDIYAIRLRDAWQTEDARVLVLVYERFGHTITFSASRGATRNWTALDLRALFSRALVQARAKFGEQASNELANAGSLVTATTVSLLDDTQLRYLAHDYRSDRVSLSGELIPPVLIVALFLMVTVAFLGPLLGRQARLQARGRRKSRFPRVQVAPRLGGDYAGGCTVAVGGSNPVGPSAAPPGRSDGNPE